ncbi:MAG: hypothetical protein H6721_14680 [Sandaracinus sp.]|nr:hypothetical protein [Sandaracinus sp.]
MTPVRTLDLPVSLRRRLLHLRGLCGAHVPAVLDARLVTEAQAALRTTFGDPLLALFANGDDALGRREIAVTKVVELTRELHRRGGPRGLIGVGMDPETGILLVSNALGTQIGTFDDFGASAMRPLETWLDDLIGAEKEALRELETEEKARTFKTLTDDEVAAFQPSLVAFERVVRRVHHPKFGTGEVVRELDAGAKLEILFAGEPKPRTLMASFVTPVD